MSKEIEQIMVRRKGCLLSVYDLGKPLTVEDKAELREVITELQKCVKGKGVRMTFDKTNYGKDTQ